MEYKGKVQMCLSKNKYTKKDALTAKNKREHEVGKDNLRVYHCPLCNHWHMTSLSKKKPKFF